MWKSHMLTILSKVEESPVTPVFTPIILRQPTGLTKTNPAEINRQEEDVNTCLGTTCHGSVWSVASCSQTGITPYFSSAFCSMWHWLSLGNQCGVKMSQILFLSNTNLSFFWKHSKSEMTFKIKMTRQIMICQKVNLCYLNMLKFYCKVAMSDISAQSYPVFG